MSFHLKDDFNGGAPISKVPASWFNSVAKFLNGLVGGEKVSFEKHDDGSPSVIEIKGGTGEASDTPALDVGYTASAGVSSELSRYDHVHKLNVGNGLGLSNDTPKKLQVKPATNGGLEVDENGVKLATLTASKWMKTDANGKPSTTDADPISLDATQNGLMYNNSGTLQHVKMGQANGVAQLNANTKVPLAQIPVSNDSNGVSRGDHNHDSAYAPIGAAFPGFDGTGSGTKASKSDHYHGNITNDGKINANYPSGGCLALIDASGNLTAASTTAEATPYVTKENVKKLLSTSNLETAGTVTLKGDHVKLSDVGKNVKTASDGTLTTTDAEYAEVSDETPMTVGDTESSGSNSKASRADHKHKLAALFSDNVSVSNSVIAVSNGDLSYNLYAQPLKFDKYGRFIGVDTSVSSRVLILAKVLVDPS